MSVREKIEDIIIDNVQDAGPDAALAADAIIAALPDMIEPLVWVDIATTFKKRGEYSITYYGGMSEPYKLLIGSQSRLYKSDEAAQQAANDHHRAQIMAAFGVEL